MKQNNIIVILVLLWKFTKLAKSRIIVSYGCRKSDIPISTFVAHDMTHNEKDMTYLIPYSHVTEWQIVVLSAL